MKLVQSPAIKIDNLTVRFGAKTVIEQFSLELMSGSSTTLLGCSGSGKSTILRCILGFAIPTVGTIHVMDQKITGNTIWHIRTHLAYVAQEPQFQPGTVKMILQRPLSYRNNNHLLKNLNRVTEMFHQFHLPTSLLDEEIGQLSGGEKQRIAIISALLLDRSILILDECTSALDKVSKKAVVDYLFFQKEMTILTASHDQDILNSSDQIIEIYSGCQK